MSRGLEVKKWAGSGFNAYARAQRRSDPDSTHVCEPCVFVCSRLSPVPGRPPKKGKKLGGNFRNYSHAAARLADGSVRYLNATKADTAELLAFILEPGGSPWAVAIATSGQKHVIPHAPLNGDADVTMIAFEDQVLRVSRRDMATLNTAMNALRASSGCSIDALTTGQYHPKDLSRDLAGVRAFEAAHGHHRGGGMFEIAAFLTSKQ
jgi:hypothetical protein